MKFNDFSLLFCLWKLFMEILNAVFLRIYLFSFLFALFKKYQSIINCLVQIVCTTNTGRTCVHVRKISTSFICLSGAGNGANASVVRLVLATQEYNYNKALSYLMTHNLFSFPKCMFVLYYFGHKKVVVNNSNPFLNNYNIF